MYLLIGSVWSWGESWWMHGSTHDVARRPISGSFVLFNEGKCVPTVSSEIRLQTLKRWLGLQEPRWQTSSGSAETLKCLIVFVPHNFVSSRTWSDCKFSIRNLIFESEWPYWFDWHSDCCCFEFSWSRKFGSKFFFPSHWYCWAGHGQVIQAMN